MVGDWVWQNNSLQPLGLPPELKEIFRAPVRVTRAQVPQFLSRHWPQLSGGGRTGSEFQAGRFFARTAGAALSARAQGRPGAVGRAAAMRLRPAHHDRRRDGGGRKHLAARSRSADALFHARFQRRARGAGPLAAQRVLRAGRATARLQLHGQNAVLNFFAREFPKLQREWSVTLDEQLENRTMKNLERVEPQFQITSSGVQWFDLGVVFASGGGETFSAADIQRLILSGQSHTRLKNGKMAVIDTGAVEELQEVLLDCAPQQHAPGYRISSTAGRVSWKRRCGSTPIGRCRRRPPGATARPNKAARQNWNARRWATWKTCCGPTRNKAWRGCIFCARTALAAFSPTKWAWGKRCKHWLF